MIDQGTTIQTDPTITRNGETGMGTIYRGEAIDGRASVFAFGSTSAFDTASGFDIQIGSGTGAVFKFTSLQLNGDPTISTTGGEINLGLIAINGISLRWSWRSLHVCWTPRIAPGHAKRVDHYRT